jgi:cell division protein FtsL
MPRFPLSRLKSLSPRIPRLGFAAGIWMVVPILVLLLVWQQASIGRLAARLEDEKNTQRDLESQVNALRLEANKLSSLGQVENRAERELGLTRPETDQIVNVVFSTSRDERTFGLRSLVTDANAAPSRKGRAR